MKRLIADLDADDLKAYREIKVKSQLVSSAGVQRMPFDEAFNIEMNLIEMEAYIATKYGVDFDDEWEIDSVEGRVYIDD